LTAEETLNRTRVGVTRASRSEQVPWISSSLAEDFSFIRGGARPQQQAARPQQQPQEPPPRVDPPRVEPQQPPKPIEIPQLPKPIEQPPKVEIPSQPQQTPQPPRENTLSDDPTIKSLTQKLNDNPDDAAALYRRGQVYASKGAYDLAIKDFNNS